MASHHCSAEAAGRFAFFLGGRTTADSWCSLGLRRLPPGTAAAEADGTAAAEAEADGMLSEIIGGGIFVGLSGTFTWSGWNELRHHNRQKMME